MIITASDGLLTDSTLLPTMLITTVTQITIATAVHNTVALCYKHSMDSVTSQDTDWTGLLTDIHTRQPYTTQLLTMQHTRLGIRETLHVSHQVKTYKL